MCLERVIIVLTNATLERHWHNLDGTTMSPSTDQQTRRPGPAPMRHQTGDTGLSLVEVTVMLAVLFILAAMMIPVVSDSINNARMVRARNDLSQMASAITGFQRDVGPFVFDGSRLRQIQTVGSLSVVDVLVSGGALPGVADSVPLGESGLFAPDASVGTTQAALRPWVAISTFDKFDNHLRVNGRRYPVSISGPGNGWNGPYVSKEITGDPWGHAYLANAGFLRGTPPAPGRCRTCAVFILSAGPNGLVETPFEQPIPNANVFGDDLAVRIQ